MKRRKGIAFLVLLLGIFVMTQAGARLLEAEQVHQEGASAYNDLRNLVRVGGGGSGSGQPQSGQPLSEQPARESGAMPALPGERVSPPRVEIDFEALHVVNRDAAAWLYCPDTAVDYPVMQAEDYSYYLDHLPDGTRNANGSLFIDYNCAPDFSDPLTVIYGHNMRSGKMFGSLDNYKAQSYYEKHPYLYLYTEEGDYTVEVLYGCVIGAGQWRERAFMYAENADALLIYASQNTTFTSGAVYQEGDRLVALSTCSYEFDNARYVLIGVLR